MSFIPVIYKTGNINCAIVIGNTETEKNNVEQDLCMMLGTTPGKKGSKLTFGPPGTLGKALAYTQTHCEQKAKKKKTHVIEPDDQLDAKGNVVMRGMKNARKRAKTTK